MFYFFDTSALVKRYHFENGTEEADRIFRETLRIIIISSLTIAEVMSTLNKIRNRGEITTQEMNISLSKFYSDYHNEEIGIIDITRKHIAFCHDLIFQYNLPSSDAIILACALDIIEFRPIFVSSDKRLLKAAEEKYFKVLNPEEV